MNSEAVPQKTFLSDTHISLGANMAPFGGFLMPIQYEGIIAEHAHARNGAVLFDTCHMGEFMLYGPKSTEDMDRLVTCSVKTIEDGQCRYGMMCNNAGGVIDDLLIYRLANDKLMIVVNASTQYNDFEWIKAGLSKETTIENIGIKTGKIDLQGPKTPPIMQRLMKESIESLKFYRFMHNTYRGQKVIVSRTGYTGEIGFEIYADADTTIKFWNDCMELGAKPAGLGARDTLRLESGMPLYGHELDTTRNAGESGFSKAIAIDKTFTGSSIVLDPALRKSALVGIELEGRRTARNGDAIIDAAGQTIGVVTSGSFAPSLAKAVAMGYVSIPNNRQGTEIAVQTSRQALTGRICGLPFYKNGTARRKLQEFLA